MPPRSTGFSLLPIRLHLGALALGLITIVGCGDGAEQAKLQEMGAATAQAAQAEALALTESVKARIEAADLDHAVPMELLQESKEAVEGALKSAGHLFEGTREDLVAAVQKELASSSNSIAALEEKFGATTEEVQLQLQFHLAALKSKRSLVEAKLARVTDAAEDAWQVLAPALEESVVAVSGAILTTEAKFDATLQLPSSTEGKWFPGKPLELYDVVKVVDGDTIHIMRNGEKQKLRLLSVDTEEKLSGQAFNPSKPETLFGEETKLWAIDYFAGLANEEGVIQIGVLFPDGEEAFDVYGRLLCHVVLPDGSDFNLKLVEEGWSPYFTKYGYSRICDEAFVAAEVKAQKAQLGIWNPEVNKPLDPDATWNKRDYDRALPWWHARGDAIRAFRQRLLADPTSIANAEDEAAMVALEAIGKVSDYPKSVFGALDRTFEESDGSLTLLFRANTGQRALRAKISKELRPKFEPLDLENRGSEGVQNYLFVSGKVVEGPRGFDIQVLSEHALSLAAPDPVYPTKE